jgi:hypothetical protein
MIRNPVIICGFPFARGQAWIPVPRSGSRTSFTGMTTEMKAFQDVPLSEALALAMPDCFGIFSTTIS